jgi:DNA-binding GntR family transcriptional regulator
LRDLITECHRVAGAWLVCKSPLGHSGLELGDFEEHVSARTGAPEERQALHLADGVPVLVLTRTTYTS